MPKMRQKSLVHIYISKLVWGDPPYRPLKGGGVLLPYLPLFTAMRFAISAFGLMLGGLRPRLCHHSEISVSGPDTLSVHWQI